MTWRTLPSRPRSTLVDVVHELSRQTREDAMAAFAKSWRRA
jgi:hypothetical protein